MSFMLGTGLGCWWMYAGGTMGMEMYCVMEVEDSEIGSHRGREGADTYTPEIRGYTEAPRLVEICIRRQRAPAAVDEPPTLLRCLPAGPSHAEGEAILRLPQDFISSSPSPGACRASLLRGRRDESSAATGC